MLDELSKACESFRASPSPFIVIGPMQEIWLLLVVTNMNEVACYLELSSSGSKSDQSTPPLVIQQTVKSSHEMKGCLRKPPEV